MSYLQTGINLENNEIKTKFNLRSKCLKKNTIPY
jgi:hypothetical protein